MAFNFNWSPLTADASFYTRAQDLLTAALNKSPKPPIIVDDILVNELNLGSVPPDLEILEIGDLAEDRFRGIFRMCYTGDAFLTLKTRVQVWLYFVQQERLNDTRAIPDMQQANPLNTYLSTRPPFASPEPLAAASGLTIPLKITLSEIKLSAFIILVFSKQKGLTLVFRNDPLESLKVSSTFDSIPFVRDYLQKEIEGQLRTLLMDEVPAIIHRLSLRLWVPEYRAREDEEIARNGNAQPPEEKATDPLASPPQDPVDLLGNALDAAQIASLSLDSTTETHSLFSQKNLLRLAALNDSHRTLSLFTPGMRDVVFRAWAGPTERGERTGFHSPVPPLYPGFTRKHSYGPSTSTTYTFSDSSETIPHSARPTLSNYGSSFTSHTLGQPKHGKPGRKRKHRVVNLRKPKGDVDDGQSVSGESSMSPTISSATSELGFPYAASQEREGELQTPPSSPPKMRDFQHSPESIDLRDTPPRLRDLTPRPPPRTNSKILGSNLRNTIDESDPPSPHPISALREQPRAAGTMCAPDRASAVPAVSPSISTPLLASPFPYAESSAGGILEKAWLMKMAGEIARRAQEQKNADRGFWDRNERDDTPPPAYGL
ncbi:ERMES complex subunit [Xylographa trunciseda]|nr:ERMES complex subunit [Xylographa trunciseda]